MTDFTNPYQAGEIGTGDPEEFTLSRERMTRMRAALVAEMRSTTPADPKGNRKMLIGALSILAPDSSLRRKLSNAANGTPTMIREGSADGQVAACAWRSRPSGCSKHICGRLCKMCYPRGFGGSRS